MIINSRQHTTRPLHLLMSYVFCYLFKYKIPLEHGHHILTSRPCQIFLPHRVANAYMTILQLQLQFSVSDPQGLGIKSLLLTN